MVCIAPLRGNIRAKGLYVISTFIGVHAVHHLGVRVRRVAPEGLLRNLAVIIFLQGPFDVTEVVERPATIADPPMHHCHCPSHDRSERQPLKGLMDLLIEALPIWISVAHLRRSIKP